MKLTVKPIKQKDAGRRLAAIDRVAADELDLSGGDFIRLDGDDGTASEDDTEAGHTGLRRLPAHDDAEHNRDQGQQHQHIHGQHAQPGDPVGGDQQHRAQGQHAQQHETGHRPAASQTRENQ